MLKDSVRDYATAAFRYYSDYKRQVSIYGTGYGVKGSEPFRTAKSGKRRRGSPVEQEIFRVHCENGSRGGEDDIQAVEETLEKLRKTGREDIAKCVEAVYFSKSDRPLRKGEMSLLVRRASNDLYISEREVYRNLKLARILFCVIRGLRTDF